MKANDGSIHDPCNPLRFVEMYHDCMDTAAVCDERARAECKFLDHRWQWSIWAVQRDRAIANAIGWASK